MVSMTDRFHTAISRNSYGRNDMTIKVSICNTDLHRKIVVTQCGRSEGRPTGTRTPVIVAPLTTIELYVHEYQNLEIEEAK